MMAYKKDIHIVEDMIIPCVIEMAMGNIIVAELKEEGTEVPLPPSCTDILLTMEKHMAGRLDNAKWKEHYRLYKAMVDSIESQGAAYPTQKREALSRRIGRALDIIDDHFKRNKFGTRKIMLVAVEWGIVLILGGAIDVPAGMVETFQKIHDLCRDELPDLQENFEAYSASALKQTEKLHNAMVNHGLFKEKSWTTLQS